ncbi:MAG: hypothetical protein KGO50_09290 [Myxococcales bacterium]|nr:hypothetical protein [Myxococcales bacterium]
MIIFDILLSQQSLFRDCVKQRTPFDTVSDSPLQVSIIRSTISSALQAMSIVVSTVFDPKQSVSVSIRVTPSRLPASAQLGAFSASVSQ